MCNVNCIVFGAKNLTKEEIIGKKVIEVGSYDVNGSLRPIVDSYKPVKYIGVDIEKGPGVDVVCSAEDIVENFGKERFDIVISTELLEHVRNWRTVISNIKNICKPNGTILITTCSYGFGYHTYPCDFWRYELEDMKNIFSDCKILVLEKDFRAPQVFIKVKKPKKFVEKDLSGYKLYSIIVNKRIREITDKDFVNPHFASLILKDKFKNFLKKCRNLFFT
jgi:SAM-dependent methyltransferase